MPCLALRAAQVAKHLGVGIKVFQPLAQRHDECGHGHNCGRFESLMVLAASRFGVLGYDLILRRLALSICLHTSPAPCARPGQTLGWRQELVAC